MWRILTLFADQSHADLEFFRLWLLKTGEYRQLIEIDGRCSHLVVRDEMSQRFLVTLWARKGWSLSPLDTNVTIGRVSVDRIETEKEKEQE